MKNECLKEWNSMFHFLIQRLQYSFYRPSVSNVGMQKEEERELHVDAPLNRQVYWKFNNWIENESGCRVDVRWNWLQVLYVGFFFFLNPKSLHFYI